MVEGFGLGIELVDCPSPLGQWFILWVEGLQVVDVPQQVGPAALLGPSQWELHTIVHKSKFDTGDSGGALLYRPGINKCPTGFEPASSAS